MTNLSLIMKRTILTGLIMGVLLPLSAQQPSMYLWYDKPAQYFEESLPIGNGKMGALLYGGTDTCLIQLNDITLWTGKPVDRNLDKDAHQWIPKIREALFNEDYQLADSLQLHVEGPNSQFYQPLGNIYLIDENKGAVSNYLGILQLDDALVNERYMRGGKSLTREYFASHPDKLIAIRLRGEDDINCKIVMTAQVPHAVKAAGNQLTQTGHATGDPQESIHFCTILQVKTDGQVVAADSSLTIRGAKEAVIYIVNETSFNGFDKHPVREGAPYLERATDAIWHTQNYSFAQFLERHVKDYEKYYQRVKLDLGEKFPTVTTDRLLREGLSPRYLETLYFQYGRYLLISSSRTWCSRQPARSLDPLPVVAMAWQLYGEHQPGGKLLASLCRQPRRDGSATGRLHPRLGRQRTAYSTQLLWCQQRLVCQP